MTDIDDFMSGPSSKPSSNTSTLESCLALMGREELLREGNAYHCRTCKSKQSALKKMELYEVPNILILTLQRFKNGVKNADLMKFPIKGLDMRPYTRKTSNDNSFGTQPDLFDLYAVINHSGTLNFGHYTAACFNEAEQAWFNHNDTWVSQISGSLEYSLVTPSAYVLFYKRRDFSLHTKDDFEKIRVAPVGSILKQS